MHTGSTPLNTLSCGVPASLLLLNRSHRMPSQASETKRSCVLCVRHLGDAVEGDIHYAHVGHDRVPLMASDGVKLGLKVMLWLAFEMGEVNHLE